MQPQDEAVTPRDEPAIIRDDVDAILAVLFDMRLELFRIRRLLQDGDAEEEEEPEP